MIQSTLVDQPNHHIKGAWQAAAILCLTNYFSAVDRYITGVVMIPIKADLKLSDTEVGLIQGLGFALLYALLTMPMGWLSDRVSRRNIIIAGTIAWTVATGLCSLASSFATLFLARLAVGLGEATLLPSAMSLLASLFGRQRLGRVISLYNMMSGFGKASSFIIGGWLLMTLDASGGLSIFGHHFKPWQAAFLIAGLAGIPLVLLQLTIKEPAKPVKQARPDSRALWDYVKRHRVAYVVHISAGISVLILTQILAAWAPSLFVRSFSMNLAEAGATVGLISLAVAPMMFCGGFLTDWLARKNIPGGPGLIMGLGAMLCVPCMIVFAFTSNLVVAIIALALAEACVYVAAQPAFVGIQLMSPTQDRGLATSAFFGAASILSIGLGPTAIGLLSDFAFAAAGQQSLAYAVATAMTAFGLFASRYTPERLDVGERG